MAMAADKVRRMTGEHVGAARQDLSGLELARAHGPGPRHPRPALRHPGHLLAQGVHPADDAVPRQVRLLHLRPAAGPPRLALPRARAGAGHRPGRGPGRLPRGAVHARRAPRGALPEPARAWLAEHGYESTVDYLAAMARLVLDEVGLLPHANAGALFPDELAALRPVSPVAGDDDRVAQPRPRGPPRLARQGARAPAGHARGRRRAGHPVHHRHPRRHRRVPRRPHRRPRGHRRVPPPLGPRAGGHRPELPAQAGHRRCSGPGPARPTTTSTPSPWPG